MPRFEYEMIYPVGGLRKIKANSLKELSTQSGYSMDIIYNKLAKNCKKTDIISVTRVLTEKAKELEKVRETKEKKPIDKNRPKIRNNKKYTYTIEKEGVKKTYNKLKDGAKELDIHVSFMYKILQNDNLSKQYKVEKLEINNDELIV